MTVAKSSNGLYLWAHDFWEGESAISTLQTSKEEIIEKYLNVFAPKLFYARAQASFGGQLSTQAIDNFFKGTNTSQGYVNQLQEKLNYYYSEELRNANQIFSSGMSKLNQKLAQTKGPLTIEDLTEEQQEDLEKMMRAQQSILDNLARLASGYEIYALERAADKGYKPPRQLKNGLFKVGNYADAGLNDAIRIYNDIITKTQELKTVAVGNNLSNSFTAFRDTAHAFHDKCAEYATMISSYEINKGQQKLFKNSPFDQSWTGNQKYIPGKGDLDVSIYYTFDPALQAIINGSNKNISLKKITAINDVSISAGPDGVIGQYGATVKDYSDKTLQATGGFTTISSSMGDIYEAAAFATTRGLPSNLATRTFINNLAGALTPGYDIMFAQYYWTKYKELLGNLLSVDALMGKMLNGNVSSKANNLVMVESGRVYYMGDIINNLRNNVRGFTGSMFGQNNFFAQDSIRVKAENAHWENFISRESAAEAENKIEAIVSTTNFKISLNMHNLLAAL